MKHYKDLQNNIYAYESDGSQDAYIKSGLVAITDAEADALRAPAPAQVKQSERNQAQADLEALDRASLREVIAYIASKADAPATLKARNLAALVLVEKIK